MESELDIETTLTLMCKRPRMFVLDASGMFHYFMGIIAEKADSADLKDEENLLVSSFTNWRTKTLGVDSIEKIFYLAQYPDAKSCVNF